MNKLIPLACVFLAQLAEAGEEWEVYSSISTQAYSEPVSVHAYTDEWHEALGHGELAVHRTLAEVGVRQGQWGLAVIWERYDVIKPNRDTVEFYHSIQNDIPFEINDRYEIDLDGYQLALNGIKLSWSHQFNSGFQFDGAFKLLQGLDFIDGKAQGSALAVDEKDYDFDLGLNYAYTADPILDRPFNAPSSSDTKGFAVDVAATYFWAPRHLIHLALDNAFAKLYWDDAGVTSVTAKSDTKVFDESGLVQFNPLLSGKEETKRYKQTIPLYINATYQQPVHANYTVRARVFGSEAKTFQDLALIAHHDDADLVFSWIPNVKALGVRWKHQSFEIGLTSDRLQFKKAHYLELLIAAQFRF